MNFKHPEGTPQGTGTGTGTGEDHLRLQTSPEGREWEGQARQTRLEVGSYRNDVSQRARGLISDTLARVLPLPPGHPPPRTPRQQSPPLTQAKRLCSQNSSRSSGTEFQEACQLPPVQTRRLK